MGPYKFIISLVIGVATCLAPFGTLRAEEPGKVLAHLHFIGTDHLASDTNAAKLNQILALPASVDLRDDLMRKLANAPGQLFARRIANGTDQSALIRPVLDDRLKSEFLTELRQGTNGAEEFVLAIELNDSQANVWKTNLSEVAAAWIGTRPKTIQKGKFTGWELSNSGALFVQFFRVEKWVVLGISKNELPLLQRWLKDIEADGHPPKLKDGNLLQTTIDWPHLQHWLPLAKLPLKLAKTEISISVKADNLRTDIQLLYPEKLDWKPHAWQMPTNLIRDPILSFTAAQNLAALIQEPKKLQQLEARPLASQFFLWALDGSPFHSFGAMPAKNADTVLRTLSTQLPDVFNKELEKNTQGKIMRETNHQQIIWSGLPIIVPFLKSTNEFLFAGLFPPMRLTNPPPAELFAQVTSRTNLVYYDWEITQGRLGQWQLLGQILPPFAPVRNAGTNHAAPPVPPLSKDKKRRHFLLDQKWLSAAAPLLGNTITEITFAGPNELHLVRKSHIGFTGFELIMLTRWIADPAFPLFGFELPPAAKPDQTGKK